MRRFGRQMLASIQSSTDSGLIVERFGCLELHVNLEVEYGGLRYHHMQTAIRVGGVRIRLPRWLAPCVDGSEKPAGAPNRTAVRVEVRLPLIGMLLSYDGVLETREART